MPCHRLGLDVQTAKRSVEKPQRTVSIGPGCAALGRPLELAVHLQWLLKMEARLAGRLERIMTQPRCLFGRQGLAMDDSVRRGRRLWVGSSSAQQAKSARSPRARGEGGPPPARQEKGREKGEKDEHASEGDEGVHDIHSLQRVLLLMMICVRPQARPDCPVLTVCGRLVL